MPHDAEQMKQFQETLKGLPITSSARYLLTVMALHLNEDGEYVGTTDELAALVGTRKRAVHYQLQQLTADGHLSSRRNWWGVARRINVAPFRKEA